MWWIPPNANVEAITTMAVVLIVGAGLLVRVSILDYLADRKKRLARLQRQYEFYRSIGLKGW